jgi:hypothetical protein
MVKGFWNIASHLPGQKTSLSLLVFEITSPALELLKPVNSLSFYSYSSAWIISSPSLFNIDKTGHLI